MVVEAWREEFENRFVEHMRASKMDDPLDETTEIGPQARKDLRICLPARLDKKAEGVCFSILLIF